MGRSNLVSCGTVVGKARVGSDGIWAVVALGVAWFLWTVGRQNFDPSHERHLIVMQAEDLNRLHVIAEAHRAGEDVWSIHEKEYDNDKRKIVPSDSDRWEGSWQRGL